MRSLCSISQVEIRAATLVGILLLGIGYARSQETGAENSTNRDLFTPYHDALSSAADRVLAAPTNHSTDGPESRLASAAIPLQTAATKASSTSGAINRVQQLRPIIEPILREESVPTELAAVLLVESGGQTTALSRKGARGLWQFMPDTARRYGLTVSRERDDRLDIQRSTRAAARYLRDLYGQFGDWQLVFAAYNAGGDLVQRAIERNHSSNFMLLSSRGSLPLETRRYVPAVLDAMQKFGNTSGFAVPLPKPRVAWILYAGTRRAPNETEFLRETKGELK